MQHTENSNAFGKHFAQPLNNNSNNKTHKTTVNAITATDCIVVKLNCLLTQTVR